MSLALYAAPFNNSENNNNKPDPIENKKKQRRQTQKRRPNQVSKLKESMISGMNNDDEHLSDWNPPPKAESVGVNRTKEKDNELLDDVPVQPASMEFVSGGSEDYAEAFQNLPSLASEEYYKQFVPYYDRTGSGTISNDELTRKLDYMIHLLEEQQDIRTGHVTEEVILYSFLGVFMIFVLDSFARAGKYVR